MYNYENERFTEKNCKVSLAGVIAGHTGGQRVLQMDESNTEKYKKDA